MFKMNIVKLIDKYSEMMTSSITLNFFDSYEKGINNICMENHEFFLDKPKLFS